MARLADLVALQELDHALDNARQMLADVTRRMGEDQHVAAAREAVTAQEAELAQVRRRQRDLEDRLEDLSTHLDPLERKLYDGSVRNPKELQGLQQDVESLKRRQRALEDDVLAVMSEGDLVAAALGARRQDAAEVERAWQETLKALTRQKQALEEDISSLEGRRAPLVAAVDPQTLRLYERLRTGKQGRAVVKLERGICQGCRITVPSTVATRVRSGMQVVQCPSCERILHAG